MITKTSINMTINKELLLEVNQSRLKHAVAIGKDIPMSVYVEYIIRYAMPHIEEIHQTIH